MDWDVQGEVMYDLLHSYAEGVPFAVEERSGIVTVIREIDDFDRTMYEFEAVAAHVIVNLLLQFPIKNISFQLKLTNFFSVCF